MLIPSNNNTFTVCDRELRQAYHITGFDVGDMGGLVLQCAQDFYNPERQRRAVTWLGRHRMISDPRVIDESFYSTDVYHRVYRQFDMHHVMWVPMSLDTQTTAMLGLYRACNQKPFSKPEQALMLRLMPYLLHAFRAVDDVGSELGPGGMSGMMVMDVKGEIIYQSPEAKLLLEKARYPRLLTDMRRQDRLFLKLAVLCRDLLGIYRGLEVPPPSFTHVGPKGQFLFRAYWLSPQAAGPESLIGVFIEHREPLVLKILRAMRDMPLSPRQKEVALLIAQGTSFDQIGKCLHIKPTTVKDHVGKLYTKLNISRREELLPLLLAVSADKAIR